MLSDSSGFAETVYMLQLYMILDDFMWEFYSLMNIVQYQFIHDKMCTGTAQQVWQPPQLSKTSLTSQLQCVCFMISLQYYNS